MSQMLSELSVHTAGELFDCPTDSLRTASPPAQRNSLCAADSKLSAELVHGVEAVLTPTSPQVRSVAVTSVVEEIYRTVEWLHGGDAGQAELVSLRQLLAAARDHEVRMATLDAQA